jgi:hypothetical protein
MAKPYHLKEIIDHELNRSRPSGIHPRNKIEKKNSLLSRGFQFLNEAMIWQTALRSEIANRNSTISQ